MRADFIARRKGVPSLPITGIIVYSIAALASLVTPAGYHNLVLAACFWSIAPLAALISRIRGEELAGNPDNPLFRLAMLARFMVLSTWAIHIPVWIYAPDLFPLTVGVAFALHWVIFSWSVGNNVGFVHLALRATLVPAAWYFVPQDRMGAVAAVVAFCYAFSVWQLSRVDGSGPARQQPAGTPA